MASNPGDDDTEALEEVMVSWRSAGSDVEVYCPGKRRIVAGAPDAERVAPTAWRGLRELGVRKRG